MSCPVCNSLEIVKIPSTCNIGSAAGSGDEISQEPDFQKFTALAQAIRPFLESFDNVGERFVEEAKRIHYGEAKPRNIRGKATSEGAQELIEEGLDILVIPYKTPEEMN